jgi:hypothetical protein
VIEVVAFARALADAGKHRIAAVGLGDVVDQLHDDDGLADPGAAEQADLAALGIGRQQVHHLDPGDENRSLGRLLRVARRRLMDRPPLLVRHRPRLIDRVADHVDDAAERAVADRHRNRLAGVGDLLATHQSFARIHRNRAHRGFAEMLRHFEHQAVAAVGGFERVQDRRQLVVEFHIDDGADDLGDASDSVGHGWSLIRLAVGAPDYTASAPEMISISSLVIMAWRVRL